jgi:galactonate dehydratase
MKITKLETYVCDAYRTNWVFVRVMTDSGLYGVGEATLEYRELAVVAAIQELERTLVGRDPHAIEAIWHDSYRDAYWRGGPILMSALAAVEMALWDIKGKDLGVPVYQLLGGKIRESIPCYANGWFAPAKTPDEFAAKAITAVDSGFHGLKWDPFGKAYMHLTREEFFAAMECVEAVVGAVGKRAEILIEGHGRFNVPTAVRVGRALERFDILWFEEPLPPDSNRALLDVKRRVRVPIAAGERLYSRWDYVEFLRLGCADFIQPDVSHAGGLMEVKKIAAMAEAQHLPACPHNPSGPVANAATLQLAACVPNFYNLETMNTDVSYRGEISTERIVMEQGSMRIPDAPGLGIDLNVEAIAAHPYVAHNLRHYAGTLTDIRPPDAKSYMQTQQ